MSKLYHRSFPDCKIPVQKQLENQLYYFRKLKFGYHNEIGPLEDKLRKFVFVVMSHMSRLLYTSTRRIIMIVYVSVMVLISE
jgi:hypothetical protein